MGTTKRKPRIALLAALFIMIAIPALAEEKDGNEEEIDKKEDSIQARRIIISLQDRKLALLEGTKVIKIWDTAVGAESTPSPSGNFTIMNRLEKPTYYRPGKVVPAGPKNPLGTRWIGLNLKSYGIHGTNAPNSIGKNASHGCIRMRNRDIEELFELVQKGDVVEIHSERTLSIAHIFKIEIEAEEVPVEMASVTTPVSNN